MRRGDEATAGGMRSSFKGRYSGTRSSAATTTATRFDEVDTDRCRCGRLSRHRLAGEESSCFRKADATDGCKRVVIVPASGEGGSRRGVRRAFAAVAGVWWGYQTRAVSMRSCDGGVPTPASVTSRRRRAGVDGARGRSSQWRCAYPGVEGASGLLEGKSRPLIRTFRPEEPCDKTSDIPNLVLSPYQVPVLGPVGLVSRSVCCGLYVPTSHSERVKYSVRCPSTLRGWLSTISARAEAFRVLFCSDYILVFVPGRGSPTVGVEVDEGYGVLRTEGTVGTQ